MYKFCSRTWGLIPYSVFCCKNRIRDRFHKQIFDIFNVTMRTMRTIIPLILVPMAQHAKFCNFIPFFRQNIHTWYFSSGCIPFFVQNIKPVISYLSTNIDNDWNVHCSKIMCIFINSWVARSGSDKYCILVFWTPTPQPILCLKSIVHVYYFPEKNINSGIVFQSVAWWIFIGAIMMLALLCFGVRLWSGIGAFRENMWKWTMFRMVL